MTLCFLCKIDQDDGNLALCKGLGHETDDAGIFQVAKEKKTKENPVTKLILFAEPEMTKIIVPPSDNNRVFAVVKIKDHYETIELDKKNSNAIDWLRIAAYDKFNVPYQEESCSSALGFLKAKLSKDLYVCNEETHLRIANVNDEIYYDLGRKDWKLIKITKDGVEPVDYAKNSPVFVRTGKISEQVNPNLSFDGDPLNEFVNLCMIPNPELFKVQLITTFIENIDVPIFALHGHAGASKSTTSSMIKRIIDPAGAENMHNLKSFPHGEDNFVTSLASSYFSGFENISHIDTETSNNLCRAVTGGSFEKRAQYTNNEVHTMSIQKKILINGVDFSINKSDLADRTIVYELVRIPKNLRQTRKFVEKRFNELLPDILGQIFSILQKVLGIVDKVEKEIKDPPRMASFGVYGEAIYQSMGHGSGEFLKIIRDSEDRNLQSLYDNNPIIPCLEHILDGKSDATLQANDLYKKIKEFVVEKDYNVKNIPQGSNGLFNWITRSKTLLDDHNIQVTRYSNSQSKEISGFTPNATIYAVKRVSTTLKDELDV